MGRKGLARILGEDDPSMVDLMREKTQKGHVLRRKKIFRFWKKSLVLSCEKRRREDQEKRNRALSPICPYLPYLPERNLRNLTLLLPNPPLSADRQAPRGREKINLSRILQ